MTKILTLLSIILAGTLMVSVHPPLSAASVACIILLMAGAVVRYHEVSALNDAKRPRQGSYIKAYARAAAPTQADRSAANGFWSYTDVERRGDSIDLCPSDSVEQIARQMVSASFRQAWRKYHAEHGGTHDLPGRIVQAQNLLLTAFRRD
jgi:hypothetical protein